MKNADAVFAIDTFIRILAEDVGFLLTPADADSHARFRQKCIDLLTMSLEACPLNTNHRQYGHGHLYAHPSWGNTNCVFCGKPEPR